MNTTTGSVKNFDENPIIKHPMTNTILLISFNGDFLYPIVNKHHAAMLTKYHR
jgi:hypothetical protein